MSSDVKAAEVAKTATTNVKKPLVDAPTTTTKKPQVDPSPKINQVQRPTDVDDILFDLISDDDGTVSVSKFWEDIKKTGLRVNDYRFKECCEAFDSQQKAQGSESNFRVNRECFKECISDNIVMISKAFKNDLVIPEFADFSKDILKIYQSCKDNDSGKPADYIPQLARVNPKYWGVSVCTIDGQRYNMGDTETPFCLQSTSKPLNYSLAVSDMGPDKVHKFIGQEPSGRSFNELTLDHNNKPHNPMINAGAIVTTHLLKPGMQMADRFEYILGQYKRMAGGEFTGFSNTTYLSERESADRNFALGYYMRENKCFLEGTDLTQTLELYFQLCSVEVTGSSASVIAATLANGGICPTTGERVLAGDAVRNTLSLMHSCGMYDYSGQFAFKVGLPAKSGVARSDLLVVHKVMGISCWSPHQD
jgi:glutaminase